MTHPKKMRNIPLKYDNVMTLVGTMQQNENDSQKTEEIKQNTEIQETNNQKNVQNNSNDDHNKKAEESKYKDGQKLTMINVRFPGNAKSHPFLMGKKKLSYNQKVMAMSDRGMNIGHINSFPYEVEFNKSMLPIKSINQIPSDHEIQAKNDLEEKEKKTEDTCKGLIDKHKLDMVITHVEIIQFGKKAVFYFNSPSRVDFRGLVKDLVSELKMRIELRQISIRDRAAGLGAIASCGQKTCCSYFLKDYGNVSIKMAKNQNITLLPGKINGVCGQIKCCMRFENELYTDKRHRLPKEGAIIKTESGDAGKVLRLHLMNETFDLLTDKGAKKRFYHLEFSKDNKLANDYLFPQKFDHIVDETQIIIGLPEKKCSGDCSCNKNCHEEISQPEEIIKPTENKPTVDNKSDNKDKNNQQKNNKKYNKKNYYSKNKNNNRNKQDNRPRNTQKPNKNK